MNDPTARKGNWITTYTGRKFYPLDPRPGDISHIDIAHSLSQICRWTGHTPWFYSVAQHSVHMAQEARRQKWERVAQLACLLHDGAEAYVGDMARPTKERPEFKFYREIEDKIQGLIFETYGVEVNHAAVKALDYRMLVTEGRLLMNMEIDEFTPSLTGRIPMWTARFARTQWLAWFKKLYKEAL